VDLKPYFDADPEWKRLAIPESVAYNTRDGKMYSTPANTTQYIGIYYNKEHFAEAGISTFPDTWDEFWVACDKLKAVLPTVNLPFFRQANKVYQGAA
jgi:raffinose/stachyose/melibiose transport system substrate-binding protein